MMVQATIRVTSRVGLEAGDQSARAGKPHVATLWSKSKPSSDRRKIAVKTHATNAETNSAVTSATTPGSRLANWLSILVIE